jgi:hypothetical protein
VALLEVRTECRILRVILEGTTHPKVEHAVLKIEHMYSIDSTAHPKVEHAVLKIEHMYSIDSTAHPKVEHTVLKIEHMYSIDSFVREVSIEHLLVYREYS